MAVSPAAGPDTLTCDPLRPPNHEAPMMPASIPENNGAPDAMAMPRHRGNATKKPPLKQVGLLLDGLKFHI